MRSLSLQNNINYFVFILSTTRKVIIQFHVQMNKPSDRISPAACFICSQI